MPTAAPSGDVAVYIYAEYASSMRSADVEWTQCILREEDITVCSRIFFQVVPLCVVWSLCTDDGSTDGKWLLLPSKHRSAISRPSYHWPTLPLAARLCFIRAICLVKLALHFLPVASIDLPFKSPPSSQPSLLFRCSRSIRFIPVTAALSCRFPSRSFFLVSFDVPTLTFSTLLSVFLHQPFETYSVCVMVLQSARKHVAMSECDADILVLSKELDSALVFGLVYVPIWRCMGWCFCGSPRYGGYPAWDALRTTAKRPFRPFPVINPSHSVCLCKSLCLSDPSFVPLSVCLPLCQLFCMGILLKWASQYVAFICAWWK